MKPKTNHKLQTWTPKRGTNPYGMPALNEGNYDSVWYSLLDIPCPQCGAVEKHLEITKKSATVRCGPLT